LLVAAAPRLPLLMVGPLAAVMGAAIGLDSPPEAISLEEAVATLVGIEVGALIALALVTAGASRLERDWQRIGVRVLGSWTAASALLAIAVRFAR
jgi:urease accessory protein